MPAANVTHRVSTCSPHGAILPGVIREIREFGQNVRRIRKERGLSQAELAELSGLHRTYISSVERGARNPTVLTILVLCRALQVEPGDLFADTP
jgi:DNA-binding XRE family transcriptional regulator